MTRTEDRALLDHALQWLSERTGVISSEWASGIEARARALLSEGEAADALYRESIARLSRTKIQQIIEECRYGIHDISRTEAAGDPALPRGARRARRRLRPRGADLQRAGHAGRPALRGPRHARGPWRS